LTGFSAPNASRHNGDLSSPLSLRSVERVGPWTTLRAALAAARKWLASYARTPIIWQCLLVLFADILINWRILFYFHSYITFGNLLLPYSEAQYRQYLSIPGVWIPFEYYGVPNATPWLSIVNYIFAIGPLGLASLALGGPTGAAKLYIILSVFLLGCSFLVFSRAIIRNSIGQLLTALFVLIGPFQLALYGSGDYIQFVSEALVVFGLYFLWKGITQPQRRWVYLPASFWLLAFSVSSPQVFVLGFALYLVFAVWFVVRHIVGQCKRVDVVTPFLRFLVLPFLLAPLFSSVFFGSLNLSPSSSYALSLSAFESNTETPLRLLLLQGYFDLNFNYLAAFGTVLADFWMVVSSALLLSIWLGYILVRDNRLVLFLAIAVGASFLGSGANGPLGPLNLYLYLHAPGYQVLNASYYWDWMLVVPAYALALGVLWEDLRDRDLGPEFKPVEKIVGPDGDRQLARGSRKSAGLGSNGFVIAIIALFVVTASVPYALGAQYETSSGIHEISYPEDYSEIPSLLQTLVGNSYAGVALFNPDVSWFLSNSSSPVQNAFFLFPTVRTPGIPVYLAPQTQSNAFFYWLYEEFYDNATRYVGQLFALVGVEYYLVFYNTQSASFFPYFLPFSYGKNASLLLDNQVGANLIFESKDFAIYQNLFFDGVSAAVKSLSVVAGGYDELAALSYAGTNLTNQALVFTTDLSPSVCRKDLAVTGHVYAENSNSLLSLGLQCNYVDSVDPLVAADTSLEPSQGWTSSNRVLGSPVIESWPGTVVVTQGGPHTLTLGLTARGCSPSCSLWIPLRFSGDGGLITFDWESESFSINTSRGFGEVNNSMAWVELPFQVPNGAGDLLVESEAASSPSSGWNAIGEVLVENSSFSSPMSIDNWLSNQLRPGEVIQETPGMSMNTVISPSPPDSSVSSSYFHYSTGLIPGGSGILLQALGSRPIILPLNLSGIKGGGWLSLLVRSLAFGTLDLRIGSYQQVVGVGVGDYNSSHQVWSWVRLHLDATELDENSQLEIQLNNGSIWLGLISFVPLGAFGNVAPTQNGLNLHVASIYQVGNISRLRIEVNSSYFDGAPASIVTGSAVLGKESDYFPYVTVRFSEVVPPGEDLAVIYNVTPGTILSMNSATFGGQSYGLPQVYYPPFLLDNPPYQNFTLEWKAYLQNGSSEGQYQFSVTVEMVNVSDEMNTSDLDSNVISSLSTNSEGYQVDLSSEAMAVLVRVGDYPGMLSMNSGVSLSPSLGSLATILWIPSGVTQISVTLASAQSLTIGIALSLVATFVWVALELVCWRYNAKARIKERDHADEYTSCKAKAN